MMNAQPANATNQNPQSVVLISASSDIPFGEPIRYEDLTAQTWPVSLAPEGAFDSVGTLLGDETTPPRRATQTINEGDLILVSNVSEFGAVVTIGSSLTPGTRAMAIRVNEVTAVGGFVTPGDRIDIVLTQGRGDAVRTGTILQDIRVLAIDQNTENASARAARTITVEVAQRDSQKLVLAQQVGMLSLTLRNDDILLSDSDLGEITLDDIWGESEPETRPEPIAAPVIEPSTTIRVRRGTAEQDVVFDQ